MKNKEREAYNSLPKDSGGFPVHNQQYWDYLNQFPQGNAGVSKVKGAWMWQTGVGFVKISDDV